MEYFQKTPFFKLLAIIVLTFAIAFNIVVFVNHESEIYLQSVGLYPNLFLFPFLIPFILWLASPPFEIFKKIYFPRGLAELSRQGKAILFLLVISPIVLTMFDNFNSGAIWLMKKESAVNAIAFEETNHTKLYSLLARGDAQSQVKKVFVSSECPTNEGDNDSKCVNEKLNSAKSDVRKSLNELTKQNLNYVNLIVYVIFLWLIIVSFMCIYIVSLTLSFKALLTDKNTDEYNDIISTESMVRLFIALIILVVWLFLKIVSTYNFSLIHDNTANKTTNIVIMAVFIFSLVSTILAVFRDEKLIKSTIMSFVGVFVGGLAIFQNESVIKFVNNLVGTQATLQSVSLCLIFSIVILLTAIIISPFGTPDDNVSDSSTS